jgi:hypothetical protein
MFYFLCFVAYSCSWFTKILCVIQKGVHSVPKNDACLKNVHGVQKLFMGFYNTFHRDSKNVHSFKIMTIGLKMVT